MAVGRNNEPTPLTVAMVAKMESDGASETLILVPKFDFSAGFHFTRTSANKLQLGLFVGGGEQTAVTSTIEFTVADGWCVIGVKKTVGSSIPKFFKIPGIGTGSIGSLQTETPGAALPAYDTGMDKVDFASTDMTIACAGIWGTLILSDSEIETLHEGFYRWTQWHPQNIRALWRFNQSDASQSVLDYTGQGANQTSITGTTVADDPAGFPLDFVYQAAPSVVM